MHHDLGHRSIIKNIPKKKEKKEKNEGYTATAPLNGRFSSSEGFALKRCRTNASQNYKNNRKTHTQYPQETYRNRGEKEVEGDSAASRDSQVVLLPLPVLLSPPSLPVYPASPSAHAPATTTAAAAAATS